MNPATNIIHHSEPGHSDDPYAILDSALNPFSTVIKAFSDLSGTIEDEYQSMSIERMTIDIPMDFDVYVNDSNGVVIGGGSPNAYADTALTPVYHQVKITLTKNE